MIVGWSARISLPTTVGEDLGVGRYLKQAPVIRRSPEAEATRPGISGEVFVHGRPERVDAA